MRRAGAASGQPFLSWKRALVAFGSGRLSGLSRVQEGLPKGPAPKKRKDKRDGEKNLFGTVFPWAQADCTALGKTYKKVGVRYSGEITYFASSRGLKRPLAIEFTRFSGPRFHG